MTDPAGDEIEVRRGGVVIWRGVLTPLAEGEPNIGDVLEAPADGITRKWVVWAKGLQS
jgi:hypothetical protein